MTRGTGRKAAASKAPKAEGERSANGAYLPVLPEGWSYHITATGPDGASVGITPNDDGSYGIAYSAEGVQRQAKAETLAKATRAAGKGIKTLDAVARQEAKARQARQEALAAFGEIDAPSKPAGSNGES